MGQLGTINVGSTELDDRLKELLEESGLEREEFEDLDWFGLLPFFVLAGASIRTQVEAHGDHFHFQGVALEVPDELEDAFLAVLPQILAQLSDDEQAAAEQASGLDEIAHPSARGEDLPRDEPARGEPGSAGGQARDERGAAAATGSTATSGAAADEGAPIQEDAGRDVTGR